jgi:hypothetical protein
MVLSAVRNWMVIKWILWSATFLAIHQLVLVYIQSLWGDDGGSTDLNGVIYGIAYGIAAIATLIPSQFSFKLLVSFIFDLSSTSEENGGNVTEWVCSVCIRSGSSDHWLSSPSSRND